MIVITAPTSRIGRRLLPVLLAAGVPLRIVVRDPARLSDAVRAGAEVIAGSHGDADVVQTAFRGADAVFWLAPPNPTAPSVHDVYSGFSAPACAALRRHRVPRVVAVSALGRGLGLAAGLVTASLEMDDAIAATGVAYRALTCPTFMDGVLPQAVTIATDGVYRSTVAPALEMPMVATRDIAAAAPRLLIDEDWDGRADVPLLGPEDLSQDGMAAIMTEVLGRPVRYERIGLEAFGQMLAGRGASPAIVTGYLEMMRAIDEGLDNAEPRTPEATTPTSFTEWCEAELLPAVRSAA